MLAAPVVRRGRRRPCALLHAWRVGGEGVCGRLRVPHPGEIQNKVKSERYDMESLLTPKRAWGVGSSECARVRVCFPLCTVCQQTFAHRAVHGMENTNHSLSHALRLVRAVWAFVRQAWCARKESWAQHCAAAPCFPPSMFLAATVHTLTPHALNAPHPLHASNTQQRLQSSAHHTCTP